jgi:hypothetical protein
MRDAGLDIDMNEFERMMQDIKAQAIERHKRQIALAAKSIDNYDSSPRRAAKSDVATAMRACHEVPAHFGYRNVFGQQAQQVML